MFVVLLLACLLAATIHSLRIEPRTTARIGEIVLLYVLVGYCGVPMLAVSIGILAAPGTMVAMLPVGEPSLVLAFFGWAYLGMSLLPILALRYRGTSLIAPAVCWAVYLGGANVVHLQGGGESAPASHGAALMTFATHGLVAVLLVAALIASGLVTGRRPAQATNP